MRVSVPDSLLSYERQLLETTLGNRGHGLVFERIDGDTELIVTGGTALQPRVIASLKNLRGFIRFARGRSNYSTEAQFCRANGIPYKLISGLSASSTAEHTLMLILALLRHMPEANALMHSGQWNHQEITNLGIRDLSEVTVGLIGLGNVGIRVSQLLRPFGTSILYYKPHRLTLSEEEELGVSWANLDSLLKQADVVSLHTRRHDSDDPILSTRHVALLQPGTILVNTGNGNDVDQEAVLQRVREGSLTVGMDVFPEEPWTLSESFADPILGNIFSPHVAGRSRATATKLVERICFEIDQLTLASSPSLGSSEPPLTQSELVGPLLRKAVDRLMPYNSLLGCSIRVSSRIERELPNVKSAITAMKCRELRIVLDERPVIFLDTPDKTMEVFVEFPPASAGRGNRLAFSTAWVPALSFLLERWQLDYALWDYLLPKNGVGSLPGKRLLVRGFNVTGRSVAWRGREIGMKVMVVDSDPRRLLDASYDGFEAFAERPPQASLTIDTDRLSNGDGLTLLQKPTAIPSGLSDEVATLVVISLHVLRNLEMCPIQQQVQHDANTICDQLLVDLIASERTSHYVPRSALWAPHRW